MDRHPHSLACAAGLDEEWLPCKPDARARESVLHSNNAAAILKSTDGNCNRHAEQQRVLTPFFFVCRLLIDHFCGVMSNVNSFGPLAVTSARRGDSFGRPNFSGVTCT